MIYSTLNGKEDFMAANKLAIIQFGKEQVELWAEEYLTKTINELKSIYGEKLKVVNYDINKIKGIHIYTKI